jgi:hypothetical protein
MLGPLVPATWAAESAVAKLPWHNRQPTPAALLSGIECGEGKEYCVPSPGLIRFMREHVRAESVLAVDYRQIHEPSMVLPQQVDVWSGAVEGLVAPEQTFTVFFRHLDRARAAALDQPLFNDRETSEERRAFVRDVRATHVLVSPRLYDAINPVIAADRDLFTRLYDDGEWALYVVERQ